MNANGDSNIFFCILVYCLVHSNWWASPLASLIASEPPCLSCQCVCGEVGGKQGWYLQDLDVVYFCFLQARLQQYMNCEIPKPHILCITYVKIF